MTTLQVETKAFPTSIPNTISRDPVSPSSQFLSFYSASEGRGRVESISSPDESGVQEGPSQDTGPASRRLEAQKLVALKRSRSFAAAVEALKLESKPRVAATTKRSNAKSGRQNNFTRPISQVEDARQIYLDDPLYYFEQAVFNTYSPPVIPRYGPQQINEGVERRKFLPDSDISIEEARRNYAPPAPPAPPLSSADREAITRHLLHPEGDSFSEDDGPIIPRNRRRKYPLPSHALSRSPPAPGRRRERWTGRVRTPSPPRQRLRTREIETRERAQRRSPSPSPERPLRITRSISPTSLRLGFDRNSTSNGRNEARIESIRNDGRLTERKAHVTSRSPSPPFREREVYYIEPPSPVNNSPPVLTGLGKWQNRKAKLWTELNPTISKDNTMGEAAQQAKMLAEFAKKRLPCAFGAKLDLYTSKEHRSGSHHRRRSESPSSSSSVERDPRRSRSRSRVRDIIGAAAASAMAAIGIREYRKRKAKVEAERERERQRRREDRARSLESLEEISDPRRRREEGDGLGRIESEQMAISRITSQYGSQRRGRSPDRFKHPRTSMAMTRKEQQDRKVEQALTEARAVKEQLQLRPSNPQLIPI